MYILNSQLKDRYVKFLYLTELYVYSTKRKHENINTLHTRTRKR